MNRRQIHDASHWVAVAVMGLIENLIRDEEKRDAYEAVYDVAKAGIERYELARATQQKRQHPMQQSEDE